MSILASFKDSIPKLQPHLQPRTVHVPIQVTRADVLNSLPANEFLCPVAQAVARATGRAVRVKQGEIKFLDKSAPQFMALPEDASARVRHYDQTGQMSPFSFALDVPRELLNDRALAALPASPSPTSRILEKIGLKMRESEMREIEAREVAAQGGVG